MGSVEARGLLRRAVILLICGLLSICPAAAQSGGASYSHTDITTTTTTVVKSGPGFLKAICVNTPATGGTATIYDSTTASGTKIGTITSDASTTPGCWVYEVQFRQGLVIVTATAAMDITVSWR